MWFNKIWTTYIPKSQMEPLHFVFVQTQNPQETKIFQSRTFTTHHSMFPLCSKKLMKNSEFLGIANCKAIWICLLEFLLFYLLNEFSLIGIGYLYFAVSIPISSVLWVSIFLVLQCQLFVGKKMCFFWLWKAARKEWCLTPDKLPNNSLSSSQRKKKPNRVQHWNCNIFTSILLWANFFPLRCTTKFILIEFVCYFNRWLQTKSWSQR